MGVVRSDLPLFLFMRTTKSHQSPTAKSGGLIASNSRNELPIIQQGEDHLVDARLLHKRLMVQARFNDWIRRRIAEYGFQPEIDFHSTLQGGLKRLNDKKPLPVALSNKVTNQAENDFYVGYLKFAIEQKMLKP